MKMTAEFKNDYVHREVELEIQRKIRSCPIMVISGPRQSGKTRLIKEYFPNLKYYDFSRESTLAMVKKNITQFVEDHRHSGAIFDEFQLVPQITGCLKALADEIIKSQEGSLHSF
jgi:predicted AAA+ superfamily ATPase